MKELSGVSEAARDLAMERFPRDIPVPDAHQEQLMQLANPLRRIITDTTFDFGMLCQTVTASFVVAIADSKDSDVERLLEAADRALYAAKAGGRNRCEVAA